MPKKTIADIFAEVDPNLTVISARRGHSKGKKVVKKLAEVAGPPPESYIPKVTTEEGYEQAKGVECPLCHNYTLRLYPLGFLGKRKACKPCIDRRIKLSENKRRVLASRNRRR